MKLILYQALKDIRLLRWLLAAWGLALIVAHGALLYASRLTLNAADAVVASASFQTAMGVAGAAILVAIAVLLVQHDSPVNPNAFWLTRPAPARTMLASKGLLVVIVLALLPAVLEAADYLLAGVALRALPPTRVPLQLAWVLPVMAIAAVTSDLPQFVLIALGEFVLMLAATGLAAALGVRPALNWHFDAFLGLVALASAGVLAWQYLTRRRIAAAIVLIVAPVAIILGVNLWPWSEPAVLKYPAEKRNAISVVADRAATTSVMIGGDRVIQIPLTIAGTPADTSLAIMPRSLRIVLRQSDSTTALGSSAYANTIQPSGDPFDQPPLSPDSPLARDVARRFASALAGTALLNARVAVVGDGRVRVACFVLKGDFARLGGAVGTLHVEFDMAAQETVALPAAPVVMGARYDGLTFRGTVLGTRADRHGISLELRDPDSGWGMVEWHLTRYVLRNRTTGQSLLGVQERSVSNFGGAGMMMPLAQSVVVSWRTISFNQRLRASPLFASDDEARRWLKDAELVLVPARDAGVFHVVLDLPDFAIAGA